MRYAAVGDSFTEGVGDDLAGGSTRGWADRVAEGLAIAAGGPIDYANLAVRGRKLSSIVSEQLPAALELDPPPTLITLNGGGNDLLRPGVDSGRLVRLMEFAARRCRAAEVELVLVSGADPSAGLPFGGTIRRRGDELSDAVRELADDYGLVMVDVFHDREIRRPEYWCHDRLHLNAVGHRRVARLVLTALGAEVPAPGPAGSSGRTGPVAEARFYAEHVVPWVHRRLRGRSSGDGRAGKHQAWTRVDP